MPTLDNHQSTDYTKPKRIQGSLFERFKNYCGPQDSVTGCIPWLASKNAKGYGQIMNDSENFRRPLLAHRVAWQAAGLTLRKDLEILHTCNNPACVNVEHLEQGTHKDNIRGASIAGTMKGPRKFTKDDCLYVKREVGKGRMQKEVAQEIGCSPALITKILKGQLKYANS